MKYKITKHYFKTRESLIAAFSELSDAKFFIATKLSQDEIERINVHYRLYDDSELVQQFNNDNQELTTPEDAETYSNAHFSFIVKMQPLNSLERIPIAAFNDKEDANLFISGKFAKGHNTDTFLIFKDDVLCATLTKNSIDNKILKNLETSKNATGATLSPLATRPMPPSGPQDYWIEKNEDEQ